MTASSLENLSEAYKLCSVLNPSAVHSKAAEWTRGGLPAQSFSDGPRSMGFRWPIDDGGHGDDSFDRLLRREVKAFDKGILDALLGLRFAFQRQLWILEPVPPLPDPVPHPCANIACTDSLEGEKRSGECDKCRQHRKRHGQAWPTKLETA